MPFIILYNLEIRMYQIFHNGCLHNIYILWHIEKVKDTDQSALLRNLFSLHLWKLWIPGNRKKREESDNILISLLRYHNWFQLSWLILIVLTKQRIRGAWGLPRVFSICTYRWQTMTRITKRGACRRTLRPVYAVCICKDPSTHWLLMSSVQTEGGTFS